MWCRECLEDVQRVERFIDAVRAGAVRGGFDIELLAEEFRPIQVRQRGVSRD